jgi:hypothetical protein
MPSPGVGAEFERMISEAKAKVSRETGDLMVMA